MVSSPIVVGRVTVDSDHADVARSLLSAQDALADIGPKDDQTKGKGSVNDSDEDYARKVQVEFLQDALRSMGDYWFAKSLADGNDSYPASTVIQEGSMDYLQSLFAKPSESFDSEPVGAQTETPDSTRFLFGPLENEHYTNEFDIDNNEEVDLEEYLDPPREFSAAAAEHRQVQLAFAISAGLPGPSGFNSGHTTTTTLDDEEQERYNFDFRAPSPSGFSRSSTDPGDPDYDMDYTELRIRNNIVDTAGGTTEMGDTTEMGSTTERSTTNMSTTEMKSTIDMRNTIDMDDMGEYDGDDGRRFDEDDVHEQEALPL
ncbi:hypothetical protein DXG01_010382 [Tephrocybe rancida]|nr:hypothetical protein DXG01_010382 [Tephrocybe rancida]